MSIRLFADSVNIHGDSDEVFHIQICQPVVEKWEPPPDYDSYVIDPDGRPSGDDIFDVDPIRKKATFDWINYAQFNSGIPTSVYIYTLERLQGYPLVDEHKQRIIAGRKFQ